MLQKEALEQYQRLIAEMSAQHEALVKRAQEQLAALTASFSEAPKPASAWIEQNGERYLLLDQMAVDELNKVFDAFREVIELLKSKGV